MSGNKLHHLLRDPMLQGYVVLAAVIAALTIWAVPAAATGNVLSERQIRALIRQEVAKIP